MPAEAKASAYLQQTAEQQSLYYVSTWRRDCSFVSRHVSDVACAKARVRAAPTWPEPMMHNCRQNLYIHCVHVAAWARTGESKPLRVTSPTSSNESPFPMHSSAIAFETRICSGCA